jgi:hypothetical protein
MQDTVRQDWSDFVIAIFVAGRKLILTNVSAIFN